MAINYVFFALEHRHAWGALGGLWHRFWAHYLEGSNDPGLLGVVAPWLAWRGLVVCSPAFYPSLPPSARDCMLRLVERALAAERFHPAFADEVMS